MRSRVLLYTGGLDSTCAWYLLGKPRALYVDLGGPLESGGIKETGFNLTVAFSPWPAVTQPDGHIALRNLHLASVGAIYADEVILGAVRGEASPDKSEKFLRAASKALTEASQGRTIKVVAPLKGMTKTELVRRLRESLGEDHAREVISHTRSCYSHTTQRCGRCMACFRRWVALSLNGIEEAHDGAPWEWSLPSVKERLGYLRGAPLREWPGVAESNAEALRALRARARAAEPG